MAIDKDVLDQLLAGRDAQELFAKDGLLDELKKALSERMLAAELDDHLESETGAGATNRRNGTSQKTVLTGSSKVTLDIPRDRSGTFDPKLIAKYQRRFPDFDDKIVSMYARGMTVREIRGHLEELYGIDVSPNLISTITDAVLETVAEWQGRPLDACYPLVFFDAIRVKIRDEGFVRNKPVLSLSKGRCTSRSASCPTAPRKSWASGSSRPRAPSMHGKAKTWHGLARAVRRGLDNMRIQAFLTAAAINLKRLAAALIWLIYAVCAFYTATNRRRPLVAA